MQIFNQVLVSMVQPGTAVIIVLHTPREKCWGIVDEINSAGVFLRGLDLNSSTNGCGQLFTEKSL